MIKYYIKKSNPLGQLLNFNFEKVKLILHVLVYSLLFYNLIFIYPSALELGEITDNTTNLPSVLMVNRISAEHSSSFYS